MTMPKSARQNASACYFDRDDSTDIHRRRTNCLAAPFINTSLQRGVETGGNTETVSTVSGMERPGTAGGRARRRLRLETVETVFVCRDCNNAPLKWGVNETGVKCQKDHVGRPMPQTPQYTVSKLVTAPTMEASWDAPAWGSAPILEVRHFRPESSDHRPETQARVGYDGTGLHGIFHVRDRYVRCVRTNYFDDVWKDSCVEFFVQPRDAAGYFNFEFNCGGAFLCCYITNPERTRDGFKAFTRLPADLGQTVKVRSSMPRRGRRMDAAILHSLYSF